MEQFLVLIKGLLPGWFPRIIDAEIGNLHAGRLCWQDIQSLVAMFLETNLDCPDDILDALRHLDKICEARLDRLHAIRETVTSDAMKYVPTLTNMRLKRICGRVKRLELKIGAPNDQKTDDMSRIPEDVGVLGRIRAPRQNLLNNDPALQHPDNQKIYHELEALFGVVLFDCTQTRRPGRMKTLCVQPPHGFCHCHVCWRLAPESLVKRQRVPFCDVHNFYDAKTTAYHDALTIVAELNERSPFVSREAARIWKISREAWTTCHDNLPAQVWTDAFRMGKYSELLQKKREPVEYLWEAIWAVFPHVCQYVLEHGGNTTSPKSILSVLDPHMRKENAVQRQLREDLHAALCLNFAYYRPELVLAEAWLARSEELSRGRSWGGRRTGSGRKPQK